MSTDPDPHPGQGDTAPDAHGGDAAPLDLDAIERLADGSHDPIMALQARRLVAEVRRLERALAAVRGQLHAEASSILRDPAHPPPAPDIAWQLRQIAGSQEQPGRWEL